MAVERKFEIRNVCKHVRSKEGFHSDNAFVEDEFHSGIYWCELTSDGLGPDGNCVDAEECSRGRTCFER